MAWGSTVGPIALCMVSDELGGCIINPLNAELNPISHLLALLGAHPILHDSRIRVNLRLRYGWGWSLWVRWVFLVAGVVWS